MQTHMRNKMYEDEDSCPKALKIIGVVFIALVMLLLSFLIYYSLFVRGSEKITAFGTKTYRVVAIDPPKHFYVTLFDVDAGEVAGKFYVSKHCSGWQKLKLNSEWQFDYTLYEYSVSKQQKLRVKTSGLCTQLEKL